jgi:lipoprotein NlpD
MHGSSNPSDNAGKPGYYSVRPGDTLTKIALDNGQAWRDIARWNKLDNPNVIEVDQVLRVAPPATEMGAVRAPNLATARPAANSAPVVASTSSPLPAASSTAPTSSAVNPDDALVFAWPHPGNLLASFDESKNKGLDLGGNAGDPVLASADGKVVYAGSGLRGYGNLVILKHNNTYLTAYAHNQSLLVKEDQTVSKGQRIAEMGNSDSDRVKLHFEIRKMGKPVDPAKFLPARP